MTTYRYKNLEYKIAKNDNVNFSVVFISDGNTGPTRINIPGPNDTLIKNADTKIIGKGSDLYSDITIIVSDIANLVPEVDEIKIQYKINGKLLIEHKNKKSEEEMPLIILLIKFIEI